MSNHAKGTLLVIGLCAGLLMGLASIVIYAIRTDTPERRAAQVEEWRGKLQDDLLQCRIRCHAIGAQTYATNGYGGAAAQCLCGGTL
jgi:hypothetical protein